jgi:hypothetical protein
MTTEPNAAAAEQFRELWDSFVRSITEIMQDPQVQAVIAARRSGAVVRERRPCHCLCGRTHPSAMGVCDAGAVTSRHYDTPALGPVDVPLCAPCAVAQGIAVGEEVTR